MAAEDVRRPGLIDRKVIRPMQKAMSRDAGGLRSAAGLDRCAAELTRLTANGTTRPGLAAWEATNLLTVATAVVVAARTREESRGAHWRDDFGDRREEWLGHQLLELTRDPDGETRLRRRFVPVGASGATLSGPTPSGPTRSGTTGRAAR